MTCLFLSYVLMSFPAYVEFKKQGLWLKAEDLENGQCRVSNGLMTVSFLLMPPSLLINKQEYTRICLPRMREHLAIFLAFREPTLVIYLEVTIYKLFYSNKLSSQVFPELH